ncbi:DUF6559 family protein [Gallaecimonas sp. GXIMD4217]|uniref:DUF6559 family protein n=1 Tax=Gallaecimonas sp. GXIMD4217 TaxID=3131927 RepID=UPI00311AE7B2
MLRDVFQSMRARRMVRSLPPILVERFSVQPSYSPAQVDWALKQSLGKLPDYRYLAYALFCQQGDFLSVTGESDGTWHHCRKSLARALFSGRLDFTVAEVLAMGESGTELATETN